MKKDTIWYCKNIATIIPVYGVSIDGYVSYWNFLVAILIWCRNNRWDNLSKYLGYFAYLHFFFSPSPLKIVRAKQHNYYNKHVNDDTEHKD